MESRGRANKGSARLESGAASELGIFKIFDGGELAVDEGGVGERPQMLGWLQLRGIDPQCQGCSAADSMHRHRASHGSA
jgi:hypothetical protein